MKIHPFNAIAVSISEYGRTQETGAVTYLESTKDAKRFPQNPTS
jgi:hypothetical protein